ncbi:MAG TPA: hypothetical protein PKD15_00890 [Candidatus Saccharibacteria bacterium]|nr:hypothetical protein [Candidatus Saccharibacteria bacterium]
MKNDTQTIRITRDGKLDLSYAIKQEIQFRSRLIGDMFVEIGHAVVDELQSVR